MAKKKNQYEDDNEATLLREENALLRSQLRKQNKTEKVESGKSKSRDNTSGYLDVCPQCGNRLTKRSIMKVSTPSVWVFCESCRFTKTFDQQQPKQNEGDKTECKSTSETKRNSVKMNSTWNKEYQSEEGAG